MTWALAALLAVVFVLACALTWATRAYALRKDMIDHPNQRSSHTVPTPRGGGLGIVMAFACGAVYLWQTGALANTWLLPVVGGSLLVALVGFIDDHRHLPPAVRLLAQFALAAGAVWSLGGLAQIRVASLQIHLGWVGHGLAVIGVVYLTNLYNFMDGIDGIAGGEAVTVAGGAAALLFADGHGIAILPALLAVGALGFLIWNWPPARIFMGDVGSGFLGFWVGILVLLRVQGEPRLLWPVLILAGVFVADASVVLVRRMLRREAFWRPHRMHAYQHAAQRWGHRAVTVAVCLVNILWLLPLAWVAWRYSAYDVWCVVAGYVPVVAIAFWLGSGSEASPRGTAL